MSRIELRWIGTTLVFGGVVSYWLLGNSRTVSNVIIALGVLVVVISCFTIKRQ